MERSVYVNHCLSLNSQLKPDKLYSQLKAQYASINADKLAQSKERPPGEE